MVYVLFILGIFVCVVIAFLAATEVTSLYTSERAEAWGRRMLGLGVLLSALLIWGYVDVVFEYFIEEVIVTTTQTVLQFKD